MKKLYALFLFLIVMRFLVGQSDSAKLAPLKINMDDWMQIKNLDTRTFPVTFQYKPDTTAKEVYLAGSFNGWDPRRTKLTGPDEDGNWNITLNLPQGMVRYKFVVNGDQWFQDTRNPNKEEDGHNGFNSILKIGKLLDISTTCYRGDGHIFSNAIDFYPHYPDLERIGDKKIKVQIRAWKNDIQEMDFIAYPNKPIKLSRYYSDDRFDYYRSEITLPRITTSYYFQAMDGKGILYYGLHGTDTKLANITQYPLIIDDLPMISPPDWAKHVVWYQIFPERFRNGDTTNDVLGNRTPSWTSEWFKLQPWEHGDFYSNVYERFYGGDLQGIMAKLPYLKELGIKAIYLNPMFMSPSIHGYDTMDYRHINPHFGYLEDTVSPPGETLDPNTWKLTKTDKLFLQFVKECHQNGIKVVLDGVFNHTGDQFWAFNDLMKNGKNSPYKDWYKVIDLGPPVKYQGWWGANQLPEIRQDSNGLVGGIRQHIFNITQHWMDPDRDGNPSDGIDGWRLDVADLIAHPFWQEWCKYVRNINPKAYISGEIWDRASDWTRPGEFDAVMNYQFTRRTFQFFVDTRPDAKYTPSQFDQALHELLSWYPYNVNFVMMNLLDSHDTDRVLSSIMNPNREFDSLNRLQDPEGKNYNWHKSTPEAIQKLKLMTLFQMTFVGAPMVWYGDEVGMWGADDPSDRKPMLWNDLEPYENSEDSPNLELLEHYKKLIAIRNQNETLQIGDFETLLTDNQKNVYVFARTGKEKIIIALNNSDKPQTVTIPTMGKSISTIYGPKNSLMYKNNYTTLTIPAIDGLILKVQ